MKPENQVCALELSQRLEELGVKQDSLFYWIYDTRYKAAFLEYKMPTFVWEHNDKSRTHLSICFVPDFKVYSAFTVAELGELLPTGFSMMKWKGYSIKSPNEWQRQLSDPSEANARAKMLIYLLENKLMELDTNLIFPPNAANAIFGE